MGWLKKLLDGWLTPVQDGRLTPGEPASYDHTLNVAGVSYRRGYPKSLLRLQGSGDRKFFDCELVREPDNPHDRNAVAVHVDNIGKVGYLPRGDAKRFAAMLDRGDLLRARGSVYVKPNHPNSPGVRLWLWEDEP